MQHGRKWIGGLAVLAVAGATCLIGASSANAKPSLGDVRAKVNTLYHQAEVASENFDANKLEIKQLRRQLADVKADQARQNRQLAGVRDQLRDSILSRFEGSSLSQVGEVLTSNDPRRFLAGLSTMTAYDGIESSLLSAYDAQVKSLELRQAATEHALGRLTQAQQQLASDKKTISGKLSQAQDLLASLQPVQREEIVSRSSDARVPDNLPPASGAAQVALEFAMAQVGKAYAYGAAGPDAYDCSGLTMAAYAAAGIALPHSSAAQYGMGPHIAESDLQPGDLVFYYSPISHVGMYIGNGLIVNAENPAGGVRVQGLNSIPDLVGAVRPG